MDIPAILKGEPHLPLTESMLLSEALPLVNAFYQTQLTMEQFSESQVFKGRDGTLTLEALSVNRDEVLITFVNKSQVAEAKDAPVVLDNPLTASQWLGPLVKVDHASELSFLDALGSGNTYPLVCDNTLAWKLAQLLNEYNSVGHWKASSFAKYSTAGFELVYKGPSEDAPEEYLVGESSMIAILRFHTGTNKGMLCLKS